MRRHFTFGIVFLVLFAILFASPVIAQRRREGCWLGAAAGGGGGLRSMPIFYPSGNQRMDMGLQEEGMALVRIFGISPRFFYLDDSGSPNAMATPEVVNPMGPDGTVLLGINLIRAEAMRDGGTGFALAAILAHEFTHLIQFKYGVGMDLPTKYNELHADFMGGWYMGVRERYRLTEVIPALQSFYEHGDYGFNNPNHHGTPEERLMAAQAGYQSSNLSVGDALQQGFQFVTGAGMMNSNLGSTDDSEPRGYESSESGSSDIRGGTTGVELTLYEQGDLSRWLCRALSSDDPEEMLDTFPGARGGSVVEDHEDHNYTWVYETSDFKVSYTYLTSKRDGHRFGFDIHLRVKSGSNVQIFSGRGDARSWLEQFGRRSEPEYYDDPDDVGLAVGDRWDNRGGGFFGFQVEVSIADQAIMISWQDPEDLLVDRFCSSR